MFTPNLLTANDRDGTYPASYYAATANATTRLPGWKAIKPVTLW